MALLKKGLAIPYVVPLPRLLPRYTEETVFLVLGAPCRVSDHSEITRLITLSLVLLLLAQSPLVDGVRKS